jgi:hypothetical protein
LVRFFFKGLTIINYALHLIFHKNSVDKFIVPDGGDKVDYVMGLSYRPARQHRLAGRYYRG